MKIRINKRWKTKMLKKRGNEEIKVHIVKRRLEKMTRNDKTVRKENKTDKHAM